PPRVSIPNPLPQGGFLAPHRHNRVLMRSCGVYDPQHDVGHDPPHYHSPLVVRGCGYFDPQQWSHCLLVADRMRGYPRHYILVALWRIGDLSVLQMRHRSTPRHYSLVAAWRIIPGVEPWRIKGADTAPKHRRNRLARNRVASLSQRGCPWV